MSIEVQTLQSAAELEQIAPAWGQLAQTHGYALADPRWCLAAARHAHASADRLNVVAAWRGDRLAALAPLMLVQRAGGARLEFVGSSALYEPAEILAEDESAARRIAEHLATLDHSTLLGRLPAHCAFVPAFLEHARRRGVVLSPASSGSPYIDCSAGWADFEAGLSSRVANIVKRADRALRRLGAVEVVFVRPEPEQTAALLDEAFAVELHSWKGRAGSAVLQRPVLREFFYDYARAASATGELLIALLRFNGSAIAAHVANIGRGAYRQLKIAYDDRYAKHLPGLQLLLHTIRWSFEESLASYEFMGVEEPWIRDWTRKARRQRSLLFYPYSIRGLRAFARDAAERTQRKVAAYLRETR